MNVVFAVTEAYEGTLRMFSTREGAETWLADQLASGELHDYMGGDTYIIDEWPVN